MKLIIAEKPSVMRELMAVLEPGAEKQGGSPGYYKGNRFVFACALGHIIVQKQPKEVSEEYARYSFDHLPFPIRPIPLRVGDGPSAGYYKTLVEIIRSYQFDEIIVATDPDREGQGIFERIRQHMRGFPKDVKISRLWVKEWTKEGLQKAFNSRESNTKYKGLGDAAECRAYDDYCFGMNGTVACSTHFRRFLSVGRVQTAVTAILVARENEITHFVPEPYGALSLVVGSDEAGKSLVLKHKIEGHLSVQEAADLYRVLQPVRSVKLAVKQKETKKQPIKLAGQTDFLQTMNKKYGYDAKKTSELLQTLYQTKKLTTYPGTEAHEISESAAKDALLPLKNLVGKVSPEIDALVKRVFDNKWTIAKHCVTTKPLAHEAITPVFGAIKADAVKGLTEAERNCYIEVIKRYLQAFYPPAVFHETEITTEAAGETFTAKGKRLVSEGYLAVVGRGEDKDVPRVTDGKQYPVLEVKNEEKKTTPPDRYTEDTLLDAMKHAGRFVDDKHYADILKSEDVEGIGTGRTRSVILDTLKKRGYYTLKKKAIYATQTAVELIGLLPKNILITSPVMTAMLEEDLKLVEEGKKSKTEHMDETDKKVVEMIQSIRNVQGCFSAQDAGTVLCQCPRCGGDIVERKQVYACAKKCGVILYKDNKFFAAIGKKLTPTVARELFTKGKVLCKGLVSKKNQSKYDMYINVSFTENGPQFTTDFPAAKGKRKTKK